MRRKTRRRETMKMMNKFDSTFGNIELMYLTMW